MTYTTILFDWDGCLANTLPTWLQACAETFRELGVENVSKQDIVEQVFGWHGESLRFGIRSEPYWQSVRSKMSPSYADIELHDGVLEVLRRLHRKGKQMVVISSAVRTLLSTAIERQGVDRFIHFYLGAEDVEMQKPHPQGVELALRRLCRNRKDAVMVGDSKHDLEMGNNAGIATVLHYPPANTDFYTLESLIKYNPSYIIHAFEELECVVG